MDHADLFRPFLGCGVERALPDQSGQGADRPVGRLRPADPDRLRRRRSAGARRGRQGRRAGVPSRRYGDPVPGHPARPDEHLHDDQRDRAVAARPLYRGGRAAGRDAGGTDRHDPERYRQGIPLPRHLHLPARALDAADRGHDRLRLPRGAEMEPDQRLQLPSAGGRGDAGAGTGLCARHRHRRARPGARCRAGGGFPRRGRPDQLLRQRRPALHHRNLQDAGLHRAVGRDLRTALWRGRSEAAPLPLRRAGQFPRPDRAAAGE